MKNWHHAVISGGGSGLGLGIAERLLRRGSRVTILDLALRDEPRQLLDRACAEGKSDWQFIAADVTSASELKTAVNAAVASFGAPQLALNSAGIIINKAFADLSAEEFQRVVSVNLNGSFHFAAATLPHIPPGGRLALIASMAGLTSNYGYAAYGASKFGVVGLATTLRFEYEPLNVGVSCICPGEVRTPMVAGENATGNPISLELKKLAGSLDVDTACNEILAGLDAGRWQIIPGRQSKLTAFLSRHFPGLFYRMCRGLLTKTVKKFEAGT
ncbi:SDR family NAD(P)-dependent oxidoreductase [Microbulbifer marinus]|uniref:NAD(P)-dependent dehydrogenase, short-chain alcohol dehydrogenase family n=1 Tax=Microbulbifer marinus TaxID=658218 RepID=A0A1H3WDD5_9GAMM|nr:SDR family NAD(P)-dependent oxidoreductase [Microbulbifer marinus]SDZ84352.1 NAD(P)-dependent dehydrogenase, short-chain alcohol dehydrogenase family [Microbulbifer marinus]